jgi:hypothetical protein
MKTKSLLGMIMSVAVLQMMLAGNLMAINGDVDGNGKLGLEDCIGILQTLSGTRIAEDGTIKCGETLSGNIGETGETDDFTFYAWTGEAVVIAIENKSASALFQPCWQLLDPSENPVIAIGDHSGHTSCETYKSYNIPDDGLFTIRVYDNGNDAGGKYNIRMEPLTAYLNGKLSCAEPITCGDTEYGTLESKYSADSYRLTAKAGEVIAIVLENKSMSALFQPCWKLLDPSAEPVIAVGDHSGHTSCETNKYYELPCDGPFTIRVYDDNRDGKGDYSIRLEPISAYFNGELSCAKTIEYDKTESGKLESNHSIDTYMFYEKDGEVIEITVTDQSTSSLFEPCWQLLNRSTEPLIAIGDHSGHTSCETTKSYNIPIEGYFIIRIYDNQQDGKGDYEITVKKL